LQDVIDETQDHSCAPTLASTSAHAPMSSAREIVPFVAPHAPIPEQAAVLTFGNISIRLTLTYLHHLRNCQGWGDRDGDAVFRAADAVMADAMTEIERAMLDQVGAKTDADR
jgi:hypothetical protein